MIRPLTPDDFAQLTKLGEAYFIESGLDGKYNNEAFSQVLEGHHDAGTLVAFGMFKGSVMAGVIIGITCMDIYRGDQCGTMFCYYVYPEFRSKGVLLFKRWDKEIMQRNVRRVHVGHLNPFNQASMSRLYRKFGYQLSEKSYTKFKESLCQSQQ